MHLRLEYQTFGIGQIELLDGNYLARALPNPHIADSELSRIAPIRVVGAVFFVRRNFHERLDHLAAFLFSDALDEFLKTLRSLPFEDVSAGDFLDDARHVFRRNRT